MTVIDGFVEEVDETAVPQALRRPVHAILASLVGRHKLKLGELQSRLGRGHRPARLAGCAPPWPRATGPARPDWSWTAASRPSAPRRPPENRLGPAFGDWGLSLQLSGNSPTGHGEQVYLFLAGSPHLDQAFRRDAPRRIGGGGMTLPLNADGAELNPEFTVSDTHAQGPIPVLSTHGRLYRASMNLNVPVPVPAPGSTTAKVTGELVDELESFPAFGIVQSHDRLAVMRASLAWNGEVLGSGVSASVTASKGMAAFGSRTRTDGGDPLSRGSDPQFSSLQGTLGVTQPLPFAAYVNLTVHAQTAFNQVLPSSETFGLTGNDALSTYSEGAINADGGITVRAQLERQWVRRVGRLALAATPYIYVASGQAWLTVPDDSTAQRATAYGLGLRFAGKNFPWGGSPTFTLEYGHTDQDRGVPPRERLYASLGMAF
ncbi:MAG: ShlB/FhaC/HecB family hemolysin secretion/activation protein [Caulobacteraceae bacterium]